MALEALCHCEYTTACTNCKWTDRGGKYDLSTLNAYCENHGIIYGVTHLYSLEYNGIVERKNRTLKNMTNAMLISYGAALNLWGKGGGGSYVVNLPHSK